MRAVEPSSSADFPDDVVSFTFTSWRTPPRERPRPTRAPVSPDRIMRASVRVRGEKPCVPRWSASSRLVLPAPLSPTTSTMPGARVRSSDAYERKFLSVTSETTSAGDQPASRIGMIRYV